VSNSEMRATHKITRHIHNQQYPQKAHSLPTKPTHILGSRILLLQHIHNAINHGITRHAHNQQCTDRACSAECFGSIQNIQFTSTCLPWFHLHKKNYTVKIHGGALPPQETLHRQEKPTRRGQSCSLRRSCRHPRHGSQVAQTAQE
jgi:hypothetical protein